MKKLLLRVGLIRTKADGSIRWPFYVAPRWMWRAHLFPAVGKRHVPVALFRNLPGVIKWEKGRLLPRRWGISIFGCVEFGDRG